MVEIAISANAGDGYFQILNTWENARSAETAFSYTNNLNYLYIANSNEGKGIAIQRATIWFDISSIPAGSTIDSATVYTCVNQITGENIYLCFCSGTYDESSVTTADFDSFTYEPLMASSNRLTQGVCDGTDFKEAGITHIQNRLDDDGILRYMVINEHDYINEAPTVSTTFSISSANAPSKKPYIVINYTEASTGLKYTTFKTPQYSGSSHHVALEWTWNSGCFNYGSGMCSTTGDGTSWRWYVISSSHLLFYPSGDATHFSWVSGNCGI